MQCMSVLFVLLSPTLDITALSLFDMDGTLVDSTAGVVGAWNLFRKSYPSIDVDHILSCELLLHCRPTLYHFDFVSGTAAHGVRTVDNLKKYCGIQDPEILEVRYLFRSLLLSRLNAVLQAEAQRFEQAIVTTASEQGRQGIVLLPGVNGVMDEVRSHIPLVNKTMYESTKASLDRCCTFLTKPMLGNLHICHAGVRLLRLSFCRYSYTRDLCCVRRCGKGKTLSRPVPLGRSEMWSRSS